MLFLNMVCLTVALAHNEWSAWRQLPLTCPTGQAFTRRTAAFKVRILRYLTLFPILTYPGPQWVCGIPWGCFAKRWKEGKY
jgi:hypothetical protein